MKRWRRIKSETLSSVNFVVSGHRQQNNVLAIFGSRELKDDAQVRGGGACPTVFHRPFQLMRSQRGSESVGLQEFQDLLKRIPQIRLALQHALAGSDEGWSCLKRALHSRSIRMISVGVAALALPPRASARASRTLLSKAARRRSMIRRRMVANNSSCSSTLSFSTASIASA